MTVNRRPVAPPAVRLAVATALLVGSVLASDPVEAAPTTSSSVGPGSSPAGTSSE